MAFKRTVQLLIVVSHSQRLASIHVDTDTHPPRAEALSLIKHTRALALQPRCLSDKPSSNADAEHNIQRADAPTLGYLYSQITSIRNAQPLFRVRNVKMFFLCLFLFFNKAKSDYLWSPIC